MCKYFLSQGIDVFCEKPLDTDPIKVQELFSIASKNRCCLFVDWLFTLNPAIDKIKALIKENNLEINSIMANRMNLGPARYDTDAKWDLASHDVSICNYLLDSFPNYIKWINFKRSIHSKTNDSSIGLLKYNNTSIQINVSWYYPIKDRTYIIDCGSNIIRWDDASKEIIFNNTNIEFDKTPPLSISIENFLNNPVSNYKQTLDITFILGTT
jgi:predicted dehydrogenase